MSFKNIYYFAMVQKEIKSEEKVILAYHLTYFNISNLSLPIKSNSHLGGVQQIAVLAQLTLSN